MHVKQGYTHSPYEIVFGNKAKLPMVQSTESYTIPGEPDKTYVNELKERIKIIHAEIPKRETMTATVEVERKYKVNSKVLMRTTPNQRQNKLVPPWQGPFVVIQTPNRFQIKYQTENGLVKTAHIKDVKPWVQTHERNYNQKLPPTERVESRNSPLP